MSRIGKLPVQIPAGVTITVADNNTVSVKGPKGELSQKIPKILTVSQEDGAVAVTRPNDEKTARSMHGLSRSLINNMVLGVTQGFSKSLDIVGVGYKAQLQGTTLVLNVGYSHPVEFVQPDGITFEVPAQNKIIIKGSDKQKVGQVAADIRKTRPPEPYKGKGIKYDTEVIRRKEGKTGK